MQRPPNGLSCFRLRLPQIQSQWSFGNLSQSLPLLIQNSLTHYYHINCKIQILYQANKFHIIGFYLPLWSNLLLLCPLHSLFSYVSFLSSRNMPAYVFHLILAVFLPSVWRVSFRSLQEFLCRIFPWLSYLKLCLIPTVLPQSFNLIVLSSKDLLAISIWSYTFLVVTCFSLSTQ